MINNHKTFCQVKLFATTINYWCSCLSHYRKLPRLQSSILNAISDTHPREGLIALNADMQIQILKKLIY